MAQPFPLVQTTDKNVNQLQQNISKAVQSIQTSMTNNSINDGVVIQVSIPAGGSIAAPQSLGRTPNGWFIVDVQSSLKDIGVWRTDWNANTITLNTDSSSTVSISVMVF